MTVELTKEQRKLANSIARKAGFSRATDIVLTGENRVVEYISAGYRKNTTGEYVSNAYRRNFGWKNTYYQHAVCVVSI